MVSREHKKAALQEKFHMLRSITNSRARNKTSIIVDASKYIQELKQKVEEHSGEISVSESSNEKDDAVPMVVVDTLEKGFLIKVFFGKSCPGLLVSILEAFEGIGLTVLEARASCTDSFHLQAVGGENEDGVDAQVVKEAVVQAIRDWRGSNEDQQN